MFDDKVILKQQAIISSMTVEERNNHKIIHASRKKRIASGSGTSIQEVNKLLIKNTEHINFDSSKIAQVKQRSKLMIEDFLQAI